MVSAASPSCELGPAPGPLWEYCFTFLHVLKTQEGIEIHKFNPIPTMKPGAGHRHGAWLAARFCKARPAPLEGSGTGGEARCRATLLLLCHSWGQRFLQSLRVLQCNKE